MAERCSSFDRIGPRASGCTTTVAEYADAAVAAGSIAGFARVYSWVAICCFSLYIDGSVCTRVLENYVYMPSDTKRGEYGMT